MVAGAGNALLEREPLAGVAIGVVVGGLAPVGARRTGRVRAAEAGRAQLCFRKGER